MSKLDRLSKLDRREFLAGTGSLLALGYGVGVPAEVLAQGRTSIAVAMARDLTGLLDPAFRVSYPEGNILRTVCPGLIAFKPGTFEWELACAESITQVSDTVIAFELKKGLMFHDGFGELTAEDVKFSFERFAKPGADGKQPTHTKDWAALDKVEVTGTHSGRIVLKMPAPALWKVVLPDVSGCLISQKAHEAGAYRLDKQPVRVIGTGAYRFAQWAPNEKVVLSANPDFKGPQPVFKELVLRPIRDPKTAELALRAGEIQFTAIPPAAAADIAKVPQVKVLKQDSINFVWVGINVEKKPFDDIRVRRAIAAALDIDQIVEGAYNGAVGRAYAAVAPGLLGYWPEAPKPKRDIALAKRLLAEAGVANLRCKLTLLNNPAYQNAGIIMKQFLAEAGITLDLEVLDPGAFWSVGGGDTGKNLELSLQRFGGKADPSFQLQWFLSGQTGIWNWQRWQNKDFDQLFEKSGSTMNERERAEGYLAMQKLMAESGAFIWLTHEVSCMAFSSTVAPAVLPNGDDLLYHRFAGA
jgi:peptide/nickel transport system substrate-binding protein